MRQFPNIIITGTPGVGKTTTSEALLSLSESEPISNGNISKITLQHLSINDITKKNNFHESYDAELDTHVVDEDALLDHLTTLMADGEGSGGFVIDWHVCDIFPARWIDLVVVLRCQDTKVFFERMEKRGYNEQKREENVDAEIFGVVVDEAREAYESQRTEQDEDEDEDEDEEEEEEEGSSTAQVVEMESVDAQQIEENAERIWSWVKEWVKKRNEEGESG